MRLVTLPPSVGFRRAWRPYQERVLGELNSHLEDRHLHVVAAPGSGKTVLGLEVVCRLNRPTLILSPTLTIRNQWVQRFCELFLPDGEECPEWITTDIREPGFITVATYQALHCAYSGEVDGENGECEEEEEVCGEDVDVSAVDLVGVLKAAGIGTLVVDEAHHLRTNWWKSLISVKRALGDPTVVALTATPPYDVSVAEWERYREMCGPVDAEISVPELVLDGNLCPHQDCVYLNYPSKEERARIEEFRREVERLKEDICTNEVFVSALEAHPWVESPKMRLEEILSDPEYFSSIAIFMHHVRGRTPKELLEVLGVSDEKVPPLDLDWLETLLTRRLYVDETYGPEIDPVLKDLRERLSRIGAVDRRQVYLRSTPKLERMLVASSQKLESVADIVRLESGAMGDGLRMVVLADFIRKSELPSGPEDIRPLSRIGVVPIFEKIRREGPRDVRLGVLSGSLVIVPRESEPLLMGLCREMGMDAEQVALRPLRHDPSYCELTMANADLHRTVELVTRLCGAGGITVLVGTKSLLGEGWDAPWVNSLVLASFVGSFMLSNQMRGRAIRSLAGHPEKTANVWHLVCVDPESRLASQDMRTLRRRFKAFVGVSASGGTIENGIDRLGIGHAPYSVDRIREINGEMCRTALDREGLRRRWEEALYRPRNMMRLVHTVSAPESALPRKLVFRNSAVALAWQMLGWGGFAYTNIRGGLGWTGDWIVDMTPMRLSAIALAATAAVTAPGFIRSARLLMKHGPVDWSIRQIGLALVRTLTHAGHIGTGFEKLSVVTESDPKDKTVSCTLEGCTAYEQSVFLDALGEILDPVGNPRYLIARRMFFGERATEDLHAVPYMIGQKKEWAEHFSEMWGRYVGPHDLIYTRTIEGRKLLLRARASSMAAEFQAECERVSCWR